MSLIVAYACNEGEGSSFAPLDFGPTGVLAGTGEWIAGPDDWAIATIGTTGEPSTITFGSPLNTSGWGAFTVMTQFRKNPTGSSSHFPLSLIGPGSADWFGFYIDYSSPNNRLACWAGATEVGPFSLDRQVDEEWIHIAASWDGSTLRVYEGGSLLGSGATSTGIADTHSIALTCAPWSGLGGGIARLRIYDEALTEGQIAVLMDLPVGEEDIGEPLATPVVTIDSISHPTTPSGTDGSVTVAWDPIDGADHYIAEIADGHDATSGFTLDDAAATSPHTFAGLAAGQYTLAISAHPGGG